MTINYGNTIPSRALELLRELDSTLDFAKSTIQLELILYLGTIRKGIRAREAAAALGLRTKSVYDALSKLMSKGLVVRHSNGCYVLTEEGERFVNKVLNLLKGGWSDLQTQSKQHLVGISAEPKSTVIHGLLTYKYLYDALLVLALCPKHEMPLSRLASILGVRPATLSSYLDLAVARRGKVGLFKKVLRATGRGGLETYYRLTDAGFQEVSRFADYRRLRGNKFLMLIFRITRSYGVWEAYAKLSTLLSILAGASSLAYMVTNAEPFLWLSSLAVTLLIGTAMIIDRASKYLSPSRT